VLLFGCTGRFYLQPTIDLVVDQVKEFPCYYQALYIYIQECHFFGTVYLKSNPVVDRMLAGVISHQPAQAWMINLTGLTAWAISLWSMLTIGCQHTRQCSLSTVPIRGSKGLRIMPAY